MRISGAIALRTLQILSGAVILLHCVQGTALAQTSTSYTLNENVMNEGGHPENGVVLASTSYRLSFDAIGEGLFAQQPCVPLSGAALANLWHPRT